MAQLPTVELVNGFLQIQFPYNLEYISAVKSIGYARWIPSSKVWVLPNSSSNLESLKKAFPSIVMGPVLKGDDKVEKENLMEAELKKYLPKQRDIKITDFKFHTKHHWHQLVTFNFMRSLPQTALFLEQGTGKTLLAIDLTTWRFRQKQIKRVFYVAPNSVVPQWETLDILQHLHSDFNHVTILEGGSKNKIKILEKILEEDKPGFIVTNYEALSGLKEFIINSQYGKIKLFDMMICDESSKIKHATSQRSKASWKIGRTVQYRNIMTGTPITQSAEDIFSQYRFLKQDIFGPYAVAFRGSYLMLGGWEQREIIGYRNVSDLFSKIFSVGIRFEKSMCLDLPPKIYQTRFSKLDKDVSAKYIQLEKECIAEFGGKEIATPLILTKLIKLSQIANGFIYEQDASGERIATHTFKSNPKLDVLDEILEDVLPNKVIIWCRFVHEIEIITKLIEARAKKLLKDGQKLKFAAIHGKVPQAERGRQVELFQKDPDCKIFVGQVATAGLGITLTAASYVVYFSNSYALEDRLQSEDRNHRIGQTKSVTYIDILATLYNGRRTIDHDVFDIIKGKAAFANEVSKALIMRMMDREIDKPVKNLVKVAEKNTELEETF